MNHRCCTRIEGWIVITELVMYNRKYSICTENYAREFHDKTVTEEMVISGRR